METQEQGREGLLLPGREVHRTGYPPQQHGIVHGGHQTKGGIVEGEQQVVEGEHGALSSAGVDLLHGELHVCILWASGASINVALVVVDSYAMLVGNCEIFEYQSKWDARMHLLLRK